MSNSLPDPTTFYLVSGPVLFSENEAIYEEWDPELNTQTSTKRIRLGEDAAALCRLFHHEALSFPEAAGKWARKRRADLDEEVAAQLHASLGALPFLQRWDLRIPPHDMMLVEQGIGGVYTHTYDLWKRLNQDGVRTILACPVDPPFRESADGFGDLLFTPSRLRDAGLRFPAERPHLILSLFRQLARLRAGKLLAFSHKKLLPYFFDLLEDTNVLTYCDGYGEEFGMLKDALGSPAGNRDRVRDELLYYFPRAESFSNVRAFCWAMESVGENWVWFSPPGTTPYSEAFKVVPPHVDLNTFHPTGEKRENLILFTTSMKKAGAKGLPQLKKVMDRMPPSVHCLIISGDAGAIREVFPDPAAVTVIRRASREEMRSFYNRAKIYFRVGTADSVPISVLEAMACKTCCLVSTTVADHMPMLKDGENSFVTNLDDTEAQVQKILSVMNDDGVEKKVAEGGYALIRKHHDMANLVEEFRKRFRRGV